MKNVEMSWKVEPKYYQKILIVFLFILYTIFQHCTFVPFSISSSTDFKTKHIYFLFVTHLSFFPFSILHYITQAYKCICRMLRAK